MTDHHIRLIDDLDAEFARVARQEARQRDARRRRRRPLSVVPRARGRALALVSVLALLFAGVATAAVTGVFAPYREPDGLVRLTAPQAIASGAFQDGRSWRLLGSQSDSGFCLELELPGTTPGSGPHTGGVCGDQLGTLNPSSLSGGSADDNAVVFGTAPQQAHTVTVTTKKGKRYTTAALDDPYGFAGKFFITDLPTHALMTLTVRALDANGNTIAFTPPPKQQRPAEQPPGRASPSPAPPRMLTHPGSGKRP